MKATHFYEFGNPRRADNRASWTDRPKLIPILLLMFATIKPLNIGDQAFFILGVWFTSLEPLFTACAFGIAVIAGATRREFIGIGAAVILAIAYTGLVWILLPADRSWVQFADWVFIRVWFAAGYIVVVSAVMRLAGWLRARYWPSGSPSEDAPGSDAAPSE